MNGRSTTNKSSSSHYGVAVAVKIRLWAIVSVMINYSTVSHRRSSAETRAQNRSKETLRVSGGSHHRHRTELVRDSGRSVQSSSTLQTTTRPSSSRLRESYRGSAPTRTMSARTFSTSTSTHAAHNHTISKVVANIQLYSERSQFQSHSFHEERRVEHKSRSRSFHEKAMSHESSRHSRGSESSSRSSKPSTRTIVGRTPSNQ